MRLIPIIRKSFVVLTIAITSLFVAVPASAGMVGTASLSSNAMQITTSADSLVEQRQWIQTQLEANGVATEDAVLRVSSLTDDQVQEIHQRIDKVVRERNISHFIELNSTFHDCLFALCGNEQLLSLLNIYRDQYYDRRVVRVFSAADWRDMPKQHQKMLDAVCQRNQKLAEKAVHEHITTALRIAIERL